MNETSDPRHPGTPGDPGTQNDATPDPAPATPGASGAYPPPPTPQSASDSFFDGIRRTGLVRAEERWIGGVAAGLALRLGIDPLIVRGLFGVSVLLGGLGLILYGLAWLLLPEQRDGRIHLQQLFRGDFDAAVLGGFAVFLTGISFPDRWTPGLWRFGDSGLWNGLLWISAVALIVVLVVSASSRRPRTWSAPPAPPAPGAPPPPPGAATTHPAAPPRRPEGPTTTMYPNQPSAAVPVQVPPRPAQTPSPAPHSPAPFSPAPYVPPQYAYGGWQPPGPTTTLTPTTRRGPGAGAAGVVVAITLLTFAGLLYAERIGRFDGPVALTTGAVAVVLLGLGVIVAGLRGRTSGGMGVVAVLLTIALVPMAVVDSDALDRPWSGSWAGESIPVGTLDRTPTTLEEAGDGYSVGAGDIDLDLTELPLGDEAVTVPVTLGAGDVVVVLPAGVGYEVDVDVRAGRVAFLDGADGVTDTGPVVDRTYTSPALEDGEPLQLRLTVSLGAGTVTIEEAGR